MTKRCSVLTKFYGKKRLKNCVEKKYKGKTRDNGKGRGMAAHRNFSRGKTAWTDKNYLFFDAPKAQMKIFAIVSGF